MNTDEQNSVTEEVANPENVTNQENQEPENQEQVVKQEEPTEPPKSSKEDNLRKLGKANDDLKRQNAELQSALLRMTQPQQQQEAKPEPELDELSGLAEDDFVSVSQVKKLAQKIAKETLKATMAEGRVERLESSFKGNHSDYDDVVNQDNFEKLFSDMPEMRAVLKTAYDSAVRGDESVDPVSLSYKLLKKYSSEGEEDVKDKKSEEKLVRNQQKPVSSNAIKSSALTEAHKYMGGNTLSKDDKARIYKETLEASKARR